MEFTDNRAKHSLGVAKRMYTEALAMTGDMKYAQEMFFLGWVHDIGYQFTSNNLVHAKVGGEFLREQGFDYWKEVYEHGDPKVENPSKELKLLNFADMHTDGAGNSVTFEDRLQDVARRYGENSIEYVVTSKLIETCR